MAGEDFIPDNQFVPDATNVNVAANAPAFIPNSQFKEDVPETALQNIKRTKGIPDNWKELGQEYDPQAQLAAIEGFGQGALPGVFSAAERATGLTTPENIRARQEKYPKESFLGTGLGAAGLIAVTGGLAAPLEAASAGTLGVTGARIAGMAAEGGAFGLANTANDLALGDTDINASKILTDVGLGAALGGGLGALSRAVEAAPSLFRRSIPTEAPSIEPQPIIDVAPEVKKTGITPQSLDDIRQEIKDAGFSRQGNELPEAKVLDAAITTVGPDMKYPILPIQRESLTSQEMRELYQRGLESDSEQGNLLRTRESLQKNNDLVPLTDKYIQEISPGTKPIEDAVAGGKAAIQAFTDNYQAEKDALKPAFEALKKNDIGTGDHLPGVISKMTDAVPGVAQMFEGEGSKLKILPYKTSWGLDKSTYSAVKEAVDSLKEGPTTFQELANIRKGLDQNIDILSKGQGPREIMSLKKSMMDYMQGVLNNSEDFLGRAKELGIDEAGLRNLYKNYAINEGEREVVERAFGASVGSPEFGAISKIKPEEISDKIFKNTATVAAAKKILSPEKFNELLANHLAEQKALMTDKGIFSSNKFASYMKRNQDALNEAFKENPDQLKKIKAVTDVMRILPDSKPINPSGTAKTLLGTLKAHSITELLSNVKEFAKDSLAHRQLIQQLNDSLSGKADQVKKLNMIQKIIQKTTDQIESNAKSIFSGKELSSNDRSAISAAAVSTSLTEFNKRTKKIRELTGDPNAMMDHFKNSTQEMYAAAPNITQSVNNKMIAGLQFLNSKIPAPQNHMPLSPEFTPSPAQISKFNKYYNVVSDPMIAFSEIKHGSLSSDTLEALNATHASLYNEMKMKVLENFKTEKAKDLSYPVKMSLAKFLGEPLDENMMPQSIVSFQASLSQPASNKQAGLKPTLGGMKELGIADRSQTRSHELASNAE